MLAGRYRLAELLGQGGMGAVWRAHDAELDREVAVKELRLPDGLDRAQRASWIARLDREARAAARLTHPGIITVHDRITGEDGRPWIVMEFVRGRSLDDLLKAEGPLPARRVAELGLQVLDALRATHRAGITHRDIKPANVLLDGDRAILTDFGVAAVEGDVTLTRSGALLGTPAFMSPEQVRGEAATPASDLWSLGATLYRAVEGRRPFEGGNPGAVFVAIATEPPPPASNAGPLEPALTGLLRKDPAERLTADQLHDLLTRAAQESWTPVVPVPAPAPEAPPSFEQPFPPPVPTGSAPTASGRRRVAVLVSAAALAAVVLVGAGGYAAVRMASDSGRKGEEGGSNGAYSGKLHVPMQLREVRAESPAPCGNARTASSDGRTCYELGGGFAVSAVDEIKMRPPDPGQGSPTPLLAVRLTNADTARFVRLTEKAAAAYRRDVNAPAAKVAVVVGDQVVMAPLMMNAIPGGAFDINPGASGKTDLEGLFRRLAGR